MSGIRVSSVDRARLRRLTDRLRGSPAGLVVLALLTGVGAGLGAIIFRILIAGFTQVFTGQPDFGTGDRAVHPALPGLGIWFIVAVPVVGGLMYGPLIAWFAPEARGHGVPEVMLSVAERAGRIRPRVAIVKSLASAICLGAGGSVGREGPIVQIGSALGSGIGQALRLGEPNLRLLVACGAAGGISATFNAPIAGVFFALELILRDFEVRSFGAVVLASVTASVIGRAAFGSAAFLPLPAFEIVSLPEYALYAVLGVMAAFVGVLFIRTLYGTEDLLDRLWGTRPEWLRPAVGGIGLGLLLLALPQLAGVGYGPLEEAMKGHVDLALLLLLMIGKLVATSLTIGIGGSGGVFAPSLFMGGMLGAAVGAVANTLFPGQVAPPGAYGLVGMGAVFAGAARAPITAVLILFELTGDYTIILPLMLAIAVAAGMSSVISRDTIYTLKLRRRGIDILRQRGTDVMELLTVGDAMRPVPAPLAADAPLSEVIDRFAHDDVDDLPVVADGGEYRGVLTAQEVEEAMRTNAMDSTVGELVQDAVPLHADQTLDVALHHLLGANGLPVLATEDGPLVGWLTRQDVLAAYVARVGGEATEGTRLPASARGRPRSAPLAWVHNLRVVDLELGHDAALAGRSVAEIHWPGLSLPISIRRGRRTFTPSRSTVLSAGDRVAVVVADGNANEVSNWLTRRIDPSDHPYDAEAAVP